MSVNMGRIRAGLLASLPSQQLLSHEFQGQLAGILAPYQAAHNLLGRLTVLQYVKQKTGKVLAMNTSSAAIPATFPKFDDENVLGFTNVPPTGALEYLRSLTPVTRDTFDGLTALYRQQAFTVSGISDAAVVAEIQAALEAVLASGATDAEFTQAVQQILSQAGLAQISQVQIDSIFNTNFASAYAAGRLQQLSDPAVTDALPYWQFFTAGDGRVRRSHEALDQFVAHHADKVWGTIFPPIWYGCRCTVVALDAEDAAKLSGGEQDVPGLERFPLAAQEVLTHHFGERHQSQCGCINHYPRRAA